MRASILTPLLVVLPTTLAERSQPPLANTTALPLNFGLVVFPGFQALDVFGPLDVLNMVQGLYNLSTTMHLDVLATTLDPASTNIYNTPGAWQEKLVVTKTLKEALAEGKQYDVLLIPGGGGTRAALEQEIAFVKAAYPNLQYLLTVCTGATIAARAGVLDGHKATTNKKAWDWAISTGPNVDWQRTARWVVDSNLWTSSGVSAGIDLTLAWVGHVYGEEPASYVSDGMEYKRTTNSTDDPFAGIWS